MHVFITGGTGLVGRRVVARLLERSHRVSALTRQERPNFPAGCDIVHGDPMTKGPWLDSLTACDAVIHLAGENVFARRWRSAFKKLLYDSRIESTRLIAEELARHSRRTDGSAKVFLCASAIGYYGPSESEERDEDSPSGDDFLARICIDWENATRPARDAGVRVANIRIGMVLDNQGGALPKMVRPFRWCLGGTIGSGKQWVSWIHVEDLVGLILFALDRPDVAGPINATAPEPLTNWGFSKTLAKVLRRPCCLPVPAFALRVLIGEAASVAVEGQRVIPRRALQFGYDYRFSDLEPALRDLLARPVIQKPSICASRDADSKNG